MTRAIGACISAVIVGATFLTHAQQPFQFHPLMLTGTPAPGLEPALVDEIGPYVDIFNSDPFTGRPEIAPGGGVGIGAQVGGDGRRATPDAPGSAVWRVANDSLTLVAAAGDSAPGTDGLLFTGFPSFFTSAPFDHDDGVAFSATASATGEFERVGLWSNRGGTLRRLLLENEPLDGIPAGATMFSSFAFVTRGSSIVAEARWCFGGGCALRDEGLFRDRTGALRPVVIRGTPAPGIKGAVFDDSGNASANTGPIHHWNASERGEFIFNGYVLGPRIDSSNNEGVWVETATGLVLLAREGTSVPGLNGWRWGAGSGFQSFGDFSVMGTPVLTSRGTALWGASITKRTYNRLGGVWSTRTGSVEQVVQTVRREPGVGGQPPQELASPAPGFEPGFRFRQVFSGRMNDAGEVYLDTDVVAETDPFTPIAAIYRLAPGSRALQLFARAGGAVPGLPGATFTQIDLGRLFETGDYIWSARVQGPGITAANNLIAFVTSASGVTTTVLRSGDQLAGRTVRGFAMARDPRSGGTVTRQVFEILFTDGSAGVFLGAQ